MLAFTIKHISENRSITETVLAYSSGAAMMYAIDRFGIGTITVRRALQ